MRVHYDEILYYRIPENVYSPGCRCKEQSFVMSKGNPYSPLQNDNKGLHSKVISYIDFRSAGFYY